MCTSDKGRKTNKTPPPKKTKQKNKPNFGLWFDVTSDARSSTVQ